MLNEEMVRRLTRLERKQSDLSLPEKSLLLAAPFQQLPMLRGLWVASVNSSGNWYDLSGLGKTLTRQNTPVVNYGAIPFWDFSSAASDYFYRADEADLDITGTETYVASGAGGIQGLTYGGWFHPDVNTGGEMSLMSKYTTAGNQRSYHLFILNTTDIIYSRLSSDGTAANTEAMPHTNFGAVTYGAWYFVVARYFTNTAHDIFANGVWDKNGTVIASIFNSSAQLQVAAAEGIRLLDGRCAVCFLCAAAASDAQIGGVFQATKGLFLV